VPHPYHNTTKIQGGGIVMSQNIVLETKQNKKGVYEVINQESSIIQKAKEAWAKLKEFIMETVNKVKAKIENIKSNPIYQEIKDSAKSFFKNTAIGAAVATAWGVVMPGFVYATIAAAFTISAVKQIKAVITAKTENKHYKFDAFDFVLETAVAWCFAITGAYALIGIIPAAFKLMAYVWIYSLIFLFV
jgi:hypothetical protein